MPINKKLLTVLLAIAIISGCKKDNTVSDDVYLGYNYFPQQPGDTLIYEVRARYKDALITTPADSTYQLLERVESVYNDNSNRPTLRLERYVRNTPNDPWIIYKVWTANLTSTNAEKREDNIPYVKLIFPVEQNAEWNGNILNPNSNSAQDYYYTYTNQPATLNNLSFDSTLMVTQKEEQLFNSGAYDFEKYATNVGLIQKQNFIYEVNTNNPNDTTYQSLYTEKLIYHN
ncbi:MAG TPA: hypothetical protein PKN75_10540 [Bacteroidia bacterium]|nr:hypothetical protein [Bacteroidia bacterium]HNU34016.1 hypothetical protein [Bacteroidia bacterium]